MAGIGFALRQLTRRDDYLGLVQAYGYSSLLTSGPWLFTIVCLASISLGVAGTTAVTDQTTFRTIIIYNFCFSLVFAGPLAMTNTRHLADLIFVRRAREGTGLLLGALGFQFVVGLAITLVFYGLFADLTPDQRVAAIVNYVVITGIWIVTVFLTALKDYYSVSLTFGVGFIVAFPAAVLLAEPLGVAGMLWGFSLGMAIVLFSLIARIYAEYPYDVRKPFGFLESVTKYPELVFVGLFATAAPWADIWVMWFAPESSLIAGIMPFYFHYDGAKFLAYLSMVPALAFFNVTVETNFFERYKVFYKDIQEHATLGQIRDNHNLLLDALFSGSRNILVLQATITTTMVFLAPQIIDVLHFNYLQLGMFRLSLLGIPFHIIILFISTVLAYFDLRRLNLAYQAMFLVTNLVFSIISMKMGFPYYGYGYFLSTVVTAIAGYAIVTSTLRKLPYLTFVNANTSVRLAGTRYSIRS